MIIGIAGKQGHGKDTVGSIIQYLTSECGNINNKSYRDYESFLSRGGGSAPRQFDFHYQSDWEIKKFAGKLKQIASLLTNIPIEKFEDQEFKKFDMNSGWGMSYREFLQKLGTEAMRDGLHQDIWVHALFSEYTPITYSDRGGWEYPNWIITDVRFPNEIKAIKEKKGIIIKVVNPRLPVPDQEHISETLLNEVEADYVIENKGTIKELEQEVRKFYKQVL